MTPYYVDEEADGHFDKLHRMEIGKVFPLLFTICTSLLFLIDTYELISNATNPVASYWSLKATWALLVIPALIVITHFAHVKLRKPNKFLVVTTLLVPSLLLLIFSNIQLVRSGQLENKLFSTDCDTFAEKRHLQNSWNAAHSFYQTCLEETVVAHPNLTITELESRFKIEDCTGYGTALEEHERDWNYLKMLEETQRCSGWCTVGPLLWASTRPKDSCSVAVSAVYANMIHPHAFQVSVLMLGVVALVVIGLVLLGPYLRKNGYDW